MSFGRRVPALPAASAAPAPAADVHQLSPEAQAFATELRRRLPEADEDISAWRRQRRGRWLRSGFTWRLLALVCLSGELALQASGGDARFAPLYLLFRGGGAVCAVMVFAAWVQRRTGSR